MAPATLDLLALHSDKMGSSGSGVDRKVLGSMVRDLCTTHADFLEAAPTAESIRLRNAKGGRHFIKDNLSGNRITLPGLQTNGR